MGTTAVITDQTNTNAAMPIKNETIHFAVVFTPNPAEGNDHGKPTKVRHTSSVKDINALKGLDENGQPIKGKDGEPVGYTGPEVIAFEQDVIKPSAGTVEGFTQLIPDTDVQLDIINKGIGSKFNQKIRTTLIEQDDAGNFTFQPSSSAYDGTPLVQEAAQRVQLSPMDKAMKAVAGLTPEMLATVMAKLQAMAANQQG